MRHPLKLSLWCGSALLSVSAHPLSQHRDPGSGSRFHPFGITTSPMRPCPAGMKVGGRIKILLPKNIDLAATPVRQVYLANDFDNEGNDDVDTDLGGPNDPNPHGVHATETEPFQIYLRRTNFSEAGDETKHAFLAVKVVISPNSTYGFYSDDRSGHWLQGVGLSEEGIAKTVCARAGQKVHKNGGREVATFFINLKKVFQNSDFAASVNMVLIPKQTPGTPVIVDPRVYNDG